MCGGKIRNDRHPKVYCSKKCQVEVEGYSRNYTKIKEDILPSFNYAPPALDPIVRVKSEFPVAIASDIHAPYHDKKWMEIFFEVCLKLGVRKVIVNGDFINAATVGRHNGLKFKRGEILENDFMAGEILMKVFAKNFDEVIFLSGNHCLDRLEKMCGGELNPQRIWKMFGDFENVKLTPKQYVILNEKTIVGHQRMYGKVRGNVSQKLANRHRMNVVTAHEHHTAYTVSECGLYQAVACPALMDTTLSDYTNDSLTMFPDHMNGFVVEDKGKLSLFDKFTNWKLYGLPEYT